MEKPITADEKKHVDCACSMCMQKRDCLYEQYMLNREKRLVRYREYYKRNAEKRREYVKQYYIRNREKRLAQAKMYRELKKNKIAHEKVKLKEVNADKGVIIVSDSEPECGVITLSDTETESDCE